MSLKVAFYSSPLRAIIKPTGVGQHISQMLEALARHDGVDISVLATPNDYKTARPHLSERSKEVPVKHLPEPERLLRGALISTNFISIERWAGNVDWVYSPKEQPVATRSARLAVTVHDVLPFEPPIISFARPVNLWSRIRWRTTMDRILQRADLIATVSGFTRRRMIELFRIRDESRLVVVGNGVSSCYFEGRGVGDAQKLEEYRLQPKGYLISVGSLTQRKGGDLLLDLAREFRDNGHHFRIAVTGQLHDQDLLLRYRALKAENPSFPLDLLGYVSVDDQAVLLRNATALLFPSRYEGFGIPALEAMAAGTPVVCSRAGALPEVCGDCAFFIDDYSVDGILAVLRHLMDSKSAAALAEAGRRRATEFTWDRCASKLVAAMGTR